MGRSKVDAEVVRKPRNSIGDWALYGQQASTRRCGEGLMYALSKAGAVSMPRRAEKECFKQPGLFRDLAHISLHDSDLGDLDFAFELVSDMIIRKCDNQSLDMFSCLQTRRPLLCD